MQAIQEFLLTYSPEHISLVIGVLMFGTSLGVIPNNTELTMIVTGTLASLGNIELPVSILLATSGLILGETVMYTLGHHFGEKFYAMKFMRKLMPIERYELIGRMVKKYPFRMFLSIRFTPAMRPLVYLAFGSFRPGFNLLYKLHYPLAICYCSLIMFSSYCLTSFLNAHLDEYKGYAIAAFIVIWVILIRNVSKLIKKEMELSCSTAN